MVTYNHHEPIIDKEVFDKVQEGRGLKKKTTVSSYAPTYRKAGLWLLQKELVLSKGTQSLF